MKKTATLTRIIGLCCIPALVIVLMTGLSSCSKTETNKAAPILTITPLTASNLAGTAVTTSVQVDSPEGGATLNILVNGAVNASLPNVTLDGSASQTIPVSFTLPANASVGSNYIITFQAADKKGQLSGVAVFAATVSATAAKTIVTKTGNILADETWTSDKIYLLDGFVRVGKDEKPTSPTTVEAPGLQTQNVTLTIQPGTVIYGKSAVGQPGGTLVIQRGNKIIANGTAALPIVFTSQKAPGTKKAGDWGGVVLCGKAKNNVIGSLSTGTNGIEELEGGYGGFHGGGANSDDADNSGSMKYVRIEYAGYPINPNQEINGLTFGSVGSATTISYIQVSYSNDDSFEWFGGTVNCDHLIGYKGIDDDFDTDLGYTGYVQFGLAIRDASVADQSGSNGFECDNDANGTSQTPITDAKFSNMTIIGGKMTSATPLNVQFQHVAQIRRNADQDVYNSFFTGFPAGVFIDGARPTGTAPSGGSVARANAGTLVFKNNLMAGVQDWGGNGFGSVASAQEIAAVSAPVGGTFPFGTNVDFGAPPRGKIITAGAGGFTNLIWAYTGAEQTINGLTPTAWFATNNELIARWQDSGLSSSVFEPLSGTPTLLPAGGSKLLSGASFTGLTIGSTGSPAAGFASVTYRGAFGAADWTTAGGAWVSWNPGQTDYSH